MAAVDNLRFANSELSKMKKTQVYEVMIFLLVSWVGSSWHECSVLYSYLLTEEHHA